MDKAIRVLQFSTHDEECGIAKYQEQFIQGMSEEDGFYTEIFPYSPNQTKNMKQPQFAIVLDELKVKLKDFDILHIQHELSFFKHSELKQIIDTAHNDKKKVIVTVHTAPHAQYRPPKLGGLGPKSFVHLARTKVSADRFIRRYVEPLKSSDLIIVHNNQTKLSLSSFGVKPGIIQIIKIPVPKLGNIPASSEISDFFNKKPGDVIYCTVGFLSRMKGITHAIKALQYLPLNYKLAIIGGNHPDTQDPEFYDEICDLISSLNLKDRVYITGYIKNDERLNALIRECDICVYPFDTKYYSYVSSASLNNAFANHKAVVAYSTKTFIEINEDGPVVAFCKSPNYYELARELSNVDISGAVKASKAYAELYAYEKEASDFVEIYRSVIKD